MFVALVLRRRTRLCAACACGLAFALGAELLAVRLESARRHAPEDVLEAAAAARVCHVARGEDWISLDLCDAVAIPFGALQAGPPLPSRMRLLEPAASPEGEWLASLIPGDRVRARLRIAPTTGLRNPGAPDRSRRLRRQGIGASARLVDPALAVRVLPETPAALESGRAGLRARLAARLRAAGSGGGLLAALAVGARGGLEAEDREAFRRLGIAHLLAVSGLHLALVGGMAFAGLRAALVAASVRLDARVPALAARVDLRLAAGAGALTVALVYAWLCGFGVPVQRAWVLLLASLVVLTLGRRASAGHALAAAASWVAITDPAAWFELGPQLSFAATAALLAMRRPVAAPVLAATRWSHLWAATARVATDGLQVSAVAIAASAPLLALHGLPSAPAGLVANAAAVPWTAVFLLPAALAATAACAFESHASALLLSAATALAEWTLVAARVAAASLPAVEAIPPPSTGVLLAATGLAILCVRARGVLLRVGLAIAVCALLRTTPLAGIEPLPPRLVLLDVGQGDAILVQGRDAAVLVDGGWALPGSADLGRSVVVPALRALGVERLDVVVVSHADLDHRGGLPAVLEAFEVGELWLPAGWEAERRELDSLLGAARRRGVPVRTQRAGVPRATRGEISLDVLWPPADARVAAWPRNERSLVLGVGLEGHRILLAGDIGALGERGLLESGASVRADLLVLPHHGSRGGSSPALLAAVGAKTALVSAPCSRRARLPAPETLARAQRHGMRIGWTGRDGAVIAALRGDSPAPLSLWAIEPKCRKL